MMKARPSPKRETLFVALVWLLTIIWLTLAVLLPR